MNGMNGKDNGEAIDDRPSRSAVDDPTPVPALPILETPLGVRLPSHQPEADRPSMPPPASAFQASLPVVLETEGDEDGEEVDDRPSRPAVDLPPPMTAPQVGMPGADRPPVHPPPAAVSGPPASIPMAYDDQAIPNLSNGTAGPRSRNSAGHRRTQSEVVMSTPQRNNSFQNIIQRAWNWGGNPQEAHRHFGFNPEELANQKRQWYQLQSKSLDPTKYEEPTALFEHLIVTGLPPHANLEAVEQAFARKKKWEAAMSRTLVVDEKQEYWFPSPPPLEPEMVFKYPPGKRLPMRAKDLCAFCFPGGVKARMVERTPSLSDLNELVYGQGHLGRDDTAFVFSLKVADNASLYGVCLLVPEIVQRPPGCLGGSSSFCRPAASRFLVSAPRCYCLLTRVPFFELHFEMLNSIVSQDRLDRITQFVSEVNVTDRVSSNKRSPDHFNEVPDSPFRNSFTDWMLSAIPVDSAVRLSASAAGIITDDEVSSIKSEETQSLPSTAANEASYGLEKETNKDERKNSHYSDDNGSGLSSPGSLLQTDSGSTNIGRTGSSISLCSSARSLEEDNNAFILTNGSGFSGDIMPMDREKESTSDFMKIVCGYNALPIPARGSEIVFHPLEHLNTIQYRRPAVSDLGLVMDFPELEIQDPSALAEVSAKLAAAEEAAALSLWTIATTCRALSLDNILSLVTGVLLEKQVVITCLNPGILSAVVLFFIPTIQPFEWQSLLLPILPEKLLDFLDAPVPFLVGIQQRPVDFMPKTNNLVYMDVFKDELKMCDLPLLPQHDMLFEKLRLIHARLVCENSLAQRQHVYRCSETQVEAVLEFKEVMRRYMELLCADIRSNTITSVQANNDRVSILLKDSFIDSFPEMDQPFMKLFIETQMFSELSDSRLSRFEQE